MAAAQAQRRRRPVRPVPDGPAGERSMRCYDAAPENHPVGTRNKKTEPMTNDSPPASSRTATLLGWSMAGLAVPLLVILPHELGHYLVLLAMDVPDLALHYASVSWDSREFWEAVRREDYATAADIAPIWGVALSPCGRAARLVCHGRGMLLRLRPVASACRVGRRRLRVPAPRVGRGPARRAGPARWAIRPPATTSSASRQLTGIPVQVLVGFGVAVVCVSGTWLAKYLPRGRRTLAVTSMLAGAVLSAVLYFGYVGPWLLP